MDKTSLSEDLQVDHKTLAKWIDSLERLYAVFRLSPFGSPRVKALKKSQKVYFYDWNAVVDEGARFENFMAVHLLKWVYFQQDTLGKNYDLRYYHDKNEREVDFVLLENNKPLLFLEAKLSQKDRSKGVSYLKSKYPDVRSVQVYLKGQKEFIDGSGVEHLNCYTLLREWV